MDSKNLKLIYTQGDDDAEHLIKLLQDLNFKYEEIIQNHLSHNDFYLTYTSPTLLSGSKIIYGASEGSTCGLPGAQLPNILELKELLS